MTIESHKTKWLLKRFRVLVRLEELNVLKIVRILVLLLPILTFVTCGHPGHSTRTLYARVSKLLLYSQVPVVFGFVVSNFLASFSV